MLAACAATATKVTEDVSGSNSVSEPVAVGVPGTAFATPPASMTEPVVVPLIVAGSSVPRMLMVTDEVVPSELATEKTSM